jgi:hypothetical protein
MRVPDVPDPLPGPRVHTWPVGEPIVRCHHISMGATEFNTSNVSRRFRPVMSGGEIVPTLYGADLPNGALSETVFHDVPVRGGGRRVQRKALVPMVRSTVIPRVDAVGRPCQSLGGSGSRPRQCAAAALCGRGVR